MTETDLEELTRETTDRLSGLAVLEFGTGWCPHCQAAQPFIQSALALYPQVQHIRIEDGKGKRLGRSYAVKLWPTLILLNNGSEFARIIRPIDTASITQALDTAT
ncbi:thiol reductase thioredoxin [Methylovorus sp. MM2]|uniref:thioredoxin family protein n=1 Tax=Methylovorus sp. MM2 TaxID=1848038 RepID=UPI0007E01B0C|nr:thioredoxin family protein [Methylovorus sp. MM2]OAM52083.1 thiol reductase thioredoxin [Methylovorus sp. MM2]